MITKSEKSKFFILEKSAVLFNQKGFSGTSLSDIVLATGMTKGAIYGHFASKDILAAEAFEYAHEKIIRELSVCIQTNKSPIDRLIAIIDFYKDYTLKPVIDGGCPILNLGPESDENLPFLKIKIKKAIQNMLFSLEKILESGIKKGEFKPDINISEEALFIYAQIEGAILLAKILDNPEILNNALLRLKNQIVNIYKK